MRPSLRILFGLIAVAGVHSAFAAIPIDSSTLGGMRARSIGPASMSGRISAIDAVPGQPGTIFVGAASGGVWKSSDGGITFKPVFDEHPQSIGAVHIDRANPQTLWVGTGESWVRNSVSPGAGVYVSRNGGESFEFAGLKDSEHIAEVLADPSRSDTVFVCATGPAWRSGGERGVYRTRDGGKSWAQVLSVNADTGCSDLAMDPNNPLILYAGTWQFRRYPDFFNSGGPGSGLYRSVDGGDSWQKVEKGLPEGDKGRIAVAVAPSDSRIVYASVESKKTAMYRSEDMGASWTEMSSAASVQFRPFYFGEIKIDPQDPQRVYRPAFMMSYSDDGAKTFTSMFSGMGMGMIHPDHHALWINPESPNHLLIGTDGGVYVSYDRGVHWRFVATLPLSQFYHVSVDQQQPYQVYGGLQDNGSWAGPSRAPGAIRNRDWSSVGYGDGFWVFADPQDPNTVFSEYQGGKLMRINRALGEVKSIAPVASDGQEDLRFNWNTALHLSPSQPGVLYYGAQYLFRSSDRGESWNAISPDLTTDDPKRQRQAQSGGIVVDNSSAENNATIYTIAESPLDPKLIWVGTDDGLVQLTRDGGASWTNLSARIPGLPKGSWISRVEASPHQAGTAFVTVDDHRRGDFKPYVYRTDDFGQSWTSLVTDTLDSYLWVIRQDPVNPGLLYLGAENGLFVSLDGGQNWARFKENLPPVAIHDIAIQTREHDLVLGTHGRGVYIIDDLTPLRALTPETMAQDVALLPSRPSVMFAGGALQEFGANDEFYGENPTEAAVITYYLKKRHLFGDLLVKVYDQDNRLITTLPGGKRVGMNRVEWPMRLKAPKFPPSTQLVPGFVGPRVPEGSYRIELVKGKQVLQGEVVLVADPRSPHSAEDRAAQQQLGLALYNELADLTYLSESMTELADAALARASESGAPAKDLKRFAESLKAFTRELAASGEGMITGEEKLREHYGTLYGNVTGYDGRPTRTQLSRHTELKAELDAAVARGDALLQGLERINSALSRAKLAPVTRISREDWNRRSESGGSGSTGNLGKYQLRAMPQRLETVIRGL